MTKISLRTYLKEIEGRLADGQAGDAAPHARYLLTVFPKAIVVYRLLGRACFENEQYTDAAGIYLRLLSSVPDDFHAHLTLGIICEAEGKLDQAIWHFERILESQPASQSLNEELRGMYQHRDGQASSKARLSRPALARLYMQGKLAAQAIAEVRAAIEELPERVDLLELLARFLAQDLQMEAAAEASRAVLRKLPYSLEANRILWSYLAASPDQSAALPYQRCLEELNPYMSFANGSTGETLADDEITIEKLEI